jgi:hypothetical protein
MEYREIVAVTGLGGLYQLLSTKSDGAIVRNLADMSTKFISARLHNVTPLESIEVYTTGANVRLHEVLALMQEQEAATPLVDGKSSDNNAIKNYFVSVFPEIDIDRVYVSDMKKILKWYHLLKSNDLLKFEKIDEQEEAQEQAAQTADELVAAPAEEKPKKAAKAKTEANAEETEGDDAKPAKKARAKKVVAETAEGEEKPKKTARKKKTEEE